MLKVNLNYDLLKKQISLNLLEQFQLFQRSAKRKMAHLAGHTVIGRFMQPGSIGNALAKTKIIENAKKKMNKMLECKHFCATNCANIKTVQVIQFFRDKETVFYQTFSDFVW